MRLTERFMLKYIIEGTGLANASLLTDFLLRMFALDPQDRATCHELLEHKWLNPAQ